MNFLNSVRLDGLPRLVGRNLANDAVLPDLFGVAGGAAVGAINLQTERGIAGTLNRINVRRIEARRPVSPCRAVSPRRAQSRTTKGRARETHARKTLKPFFMISPPCRAVAQRRRTISNGDLMRPSSF